jgi:hypothetical protein
MYMKTKEEVKMSSRHDPKKPLIRLATLATLSPGERAVGGILYKNRGNEARKLLKTKDGGCYKVQKRTQKEPVFEHKVRETSEVARRYAVLAFLRGSLVSHAPDRFGVLGPSKGRGGSQTAATSALHVPILAEQSQNVYENK